MKSIKRGRGPSMMEGAGAVFTIIFGVIWLFAAVSIGAPVFFALFGVAFIGMAVVRAVYAFRNASGEERFSEYDITDSEEEGDPLNRKYGKTAEREESWNERETIISENAGGAERIYCHYCGAALQVDFEFCMKCGARLPR